MLVGESGCATHPGRRDHNDDVALVDDSAGVWAVIDGMRGNLEPRPVVDEAIARTPWAGRPAGELVALFDRTLATLGQGTPDAARTRAAITAATLDDDVVEIANLGNVLAVVINDGAHLVSDPHTTLREQVRMGLRSPDDPPRPLDAVVTKIAGTGLGGVAVDHIPVDDGDTLILVSQGVCAEFDRGPLTLDDLRNLAAGRDPRDAAEAIVAEAVQRQTEPNATAIVVRFEEA
jgi:serine/threonine protein phosphatase PrpC